MKAVRQVLAPSDRAALSRIARTTMPASRLFAEPGERCVARLETFLTSVSPSVRTGYLALLHAITRLAGGGDDASVGRALERWRTSGYPRRAAVRALTAPLKVAHFSDPAMY